MACMSVGRPCPRTQTGHNATGHCRAPQLPGVKNSGPSTLDAPGSSDGQGRLIDRASTAHALGTARAAGLVKMSATNTGRGGGAVSITDVTAVYSVLYALSLADSKSAEIKGAARAADVDARLITRYASTYNDILSLALALAAVHTGLSPTAAQTLSRNIKRTASHFRLKDFVNAAREQHFRQYAKREGGGMTLGAGWNAALLQLIERFDNVKPLGKHDRSVRRPRTHGPTCPSFDALTRPACVCSWRLPCVASRTAGCPPFRMRCSSPPFGCARRCACLRVCVHSPPPLLTPLHTDQCR